MFDYDNWKCNKPCRSVAPLASSVAREMIETGYLVLDDVRAFDYQQDVKLKDGTTGKICGCNLNDDGSRSWEVLFIESDPEDDTSEWFSESELRSV